MLEIGCGTGRVLAPLAAEGHEVVGVDLSPDMLAICRRKLGARPASLVLADMRRFALRRRFRLVLLLCNTIWHCLTREDALAALARAREHLDPSGRFVLDVSLPDEAILAAAHGRTATARYEDPAEGRTLLCEFTPHHDLDRRLERDRILLREVREGRVTRSAATEVTLRWYGLEELRDLLREAAFEILEEPIPPEEGEALFVCGPAAAPIFS